MQNRIKMNTKNLQKDFSAVYQEFFVNHDLVVSGCFSLAWSPVWIWEHNVLNYIKQKLPTKCYIWFKFIKDNDKIEINNTYFYNLNKEMFESFSFEEVNNQKEKLIDYLFLLKSDLWIDNWIEISILSENMRGHWVWFAWTVSSIIAVWLYIMSWKLKKEDLDNYNSFIESDNFKDIHLIARKQDFISRYGKTIWENSLFALTNIPNPILYMNEKKKYNQIDDLNNNKILFFDIFQKFSKTEASKIMPVDYTMIFSGIQNQTQQVEHYRDLDIVNWNKVKDFILEYIIDENQKSYGLSSLIESGTIQDWYNKIMLTLNTQLLYYFFKMINEVYESSNINNFINQINLYRRAITLVENQSPFAEDFMKTFDEQKINNDEIIWIMPVYSGKFGWGYLLVMKENYSRETLSKTIKELKNKYKNCAIEYASWLDGTSSDGVKVEQFISEEIYSNHFDKDKLILQTNKWEKTLGEHGEFMKNMWEGILVDTINRKIYVNGQKLTSKDIPSQATVVEVLYMLLENEWKEVSNDIFQVSSYSKNKNDMIWKIVIPMKKLTKKYFWKEIDITCKWSLIEFQMVLNEKDIDIGLIKKI